MDASYLIILGLIVLLSLVYYFSKRKSLVSGDHWSNRNIDPDENPYQDLRRLVFSATPEEFGLDTTNQEAAYAVLMEIGIEEGTVTLVSIIDGNASIYLSSGSGTIGGYGYESVRKAAIDFVHLGQEYFSKMTIVDSFPLPKTDQVRFYIFTNRGRYSIKEEIEKIENEQSDWVELFYAGNKVLTEFRLLQLL